MLIYLMLFVYMFTRINHNPYRNINESYSSIVEPSPNESTTKLLYLRPGIIEENRVETL